MILDAALGLVLAFAIGVACRYFDLPLPAPPTLTGAFLVFCTTLGFVLTGLIIG